MTDLSQVSDADLMSSLPRGARNNNPLNVTGTGWAGQTGSDGRFATFATADAGRAAADQNLQAYHGKHGIDTVAGVVSRWAPPNENDTAAYIDRVSRKLGVDPNARLGLADAGARSQLLDAMSEHETPGSIAPVDLKSISDADLMASLQAHGGDAAPPPSKLPLPRQVVTNAKTGKPYNDAQQAAYGRLMDAGQLDPSARPGTKAFPTGMTDGGDPDLVPGDWYIDLDGSLKQSPGGNVEPYSFTKSLTDPITQPVDALSRDAQRFRDAKPHGDWRDFVPGFNDKDKAFGSMMMDAAGLAGGVLGGQVLNAGVIEPGARLLDALPLDAYRGAGLKIDGSGVHVTPVQRMSAAEKHEANRDIVGTALSAARPATAGPFEPVLPQRSGPRVRPAELRQQADALYTEMRHRDVQLTPQAVQSLRQGMGDVVGNLRAVYPEHARWIDTVGNTLAQEPTIEALDTLRSKMQQALTTPTGATTPDQLRVGSQLVDEIDNFIGAVARHPQAMTTGTGDPARVGQILTQARDIWRRMRNVQTVENLTESAGIRNATTHMGGNAQNFTKQKLRDFVDPTKNKALAGLSPAELRQLRRVVMGTPATGLLKTLGNLSPTKGLGMLLNTTLAWPTAGKFPAIAMPLGYAANVGGARLQAHEVEQLLRLLAGGGPAPRAPLPTTVPLRSPAGLVGASVVAAPLVRSPADQGSAKKGR